MILISSFQSNLLIVGIILSPTISRKLLGSLVSFIFVR